MKAFRRTLVLGTALFATTATTVEAQTQRALERRAARNERQLQRQVDRADYYSDQAWQDIDPWVQRNGITPLQRAANAVRDAAGAVGNVVDRTTDAVDVAVDGDVRYGYRDRSDANGWFYDYYSYTPTYYYGPAGGDRYAGVIRYYDADADGVYDSHSLYRDSDDDGVYDQYNRLDFQARQQPADAAADDQGPGYAAADNDGPEDARRYTLEGEIAMTKSAQVNGDEHLVVGLKRDGADAQAIDLGPAEALQGAGIEVGNSIVATGAMQRVGDKQLLIADTVRVGNGQPIQIDQGGSLQVSGSIVDITESTIGSTSHYIAVVQVEGERQLVDLGPASTYKVKPEANTEIRVHGVPVQTRGHRVIMANRVQISGETISVDRTQTFAL